VQSQSRIWQYFPNLSLVSPHDTTFRFGLLGATTHPPGFVPVASSEWPTPADRSANSIIASLVFPALCRANGWPCSKEKSVPRGKPGSKDRSGPFRASSQELRMFRLALLQNPDGGAEHLRGPCRRGHPVTLRNTVRLGSGGYRCRCADSAYR
jgi:hypothetical protein